MFATLRTSAPVTLLPMFELPTAFDDNLASAPAPLRSRPAAADEERLNVLIEATARGDRRAYERLYRLTSKRLLGVAWRILHRHELAEEALHDAFIRIWSNADRYEAHLSAPMTWMSSIVRNRALDMLRRTSREEHIDDESSWLDDVPSEDAGPADLALHGQHVGLLHASLERLDPNQRRALQLAYYEGLSHPELAERMGAPLGTVKTWVRRGLIALQKQMATA